jgi:creatinine amidohydrolase/Fe(II)-dependent formamide hydrolase-like protein
MNTPLGVWLDDLTRQEAVSRFEGDAVAVVPVASGGPDSPHLPLKTATVIARALGQKLLERLAIVVASVVEAEPRPRRDTLGHMLAARLDGLRSLGARRIAILDVAPSGGAPFDITGDVLLLRVCDRSDAEEYFTSCMMAVDPRSVRMPLLPAGSRSEAFDGERGMAAEVEAVAGALVSKWPDLFHR